MPARLPPDVGGTIPPARRGRKRPERPAAQQALAARDISARRTRDGGSFARMPRAEYGAGGRRRVHAVRTRFPARRRLSTAPRLTRRGRRVAPHERAATRARVPSEPAGAAADSAARRATPIVDRRTTVVVQPRRAPLARIAIGPPDTRA